MIYKITDLLFYLVIIQLRIASDLRLVSRSIVISQVSFLPEADTALLASKWLVQRVGPPVPRQLVLHSEALSADITNVVLLPRVRRLMTDHLLFPSKELLTVTTFKRILVRVNLTMNVKRGFSLKGLAAGVADIRPFSRMDPTVVLHGCLHSETSAADIAGVILHSTVDVLQVIIQTTCLTELFTAEVASVGLLPCVSPHVDLVAVVHAEFLVALSALEVADVRNGRVVRVELASRLFRFVR